MTDSRAALSDLAACEAAVASLDGKKVTITFPEAYRDLVERWQIAKGDERTVILDEMIARARTLGHLSGRRAGNAAS